MDGRPRGGQFGERFGSSGEPHDSLLKEIDLVLEEMDGSGVDSGLYEGQGSDPGFAEPGEVRRAMDEPGPGEAI